MSLLDKLYKVAAAEMMGQPPMQQPMPGQQPGDMPSGGDPAMMGAPGMMMPPQDPVAEDNNKITSLIQNLQLRTQLLQAQQELAETQSESSQKGQVDPAVDPDTGEMVEKNPALRAAAQQIKSTTSTLGVKAPSTESSRKKMEKKDKAAKDSKSTGDVQAQGQDSGSQVSNQTSDSEAAYS